MSDSVRRPSQGNALVGHAPRFVPVASAYRAAGYVIPAGVADSAVPTNYAADTVTPAGVVIRVK